MKAKGIHSEIQDISVRNPYLVPNEELRGTTPPYVNTLTFLAASKAEDPASVSGGGTTLSSLPNPIANIYIRLPNGSVSSPALTWVADTGSGRYRIGINNYGESVAGDLVFDWNATRLRLDSGFFLDITDMTLGSVLFAGSGGRVTQDNSNLFWDDTNNRLGINAAAAPARRLEVRDNGGAGAVRITHTAASLFADLYTNSSGNFNIAPSGNGTFSSGSTSGAQAFTLGTEQNGSGDSRLSASQFGGTGDCYVLLFAGGINWVFGIDRSDTDSFVWSSGTPGTSNKMKLTTGGLLSIPLSNSLASPGLDVTQASTGDAAIRYALGSTISYIVGIDNSVSGDPFVLSTAASGGAALGTGNLWSITALGYSTWSISDSAATPFHDLIQSSTGDSALRFALGSTISYAFGVDNSVSGDPFVLATAASAAAALGTGNILSITSGGLATWSRSDALTTPTEDLIQSSTGDAATRWTLGSTISYALGIDNSVAGDPFVLATAASGTAALGTGNLLSITSGGLATWSRSDSVTTPTHDLIQSSTGDSAIRFAIGSTSSWAVGADNSATGDPFIISYAASGSAALGTTDRFTIGSDGEITVAQWFQVGTATDSATQGDLASGLTGAARMFYDQSVTSLTLYDASGNADVVIHANGVSYFMAGNVGIGTTGADRPLDVLSTAGPQMRLTYADASIYTDFEANADGDLIITPSGDECGFAKSIIGAQMYLGVQNLDATNAASDSCFYAYTNGASSGSPMVVFDNATSNKWTVGLHNSDSDKFKISQAGYAFGTNDYFAIELGGTVWFGTHSAIGVETVTGYITIKDAAGNTRKLAVVS